jgi:hypothetical protein
MPKHRKGILMPSDKIIRVEMEDYILYDRLNALATEYATTVDQLVNISVRRLLSDLDFFWQLRRGKFAPNPRQDEQT